jgi:hypothetical protein
MENSFSIINHNRQHTIEKSHNVDFEKSKQLFQLFDDNCANSDDLIIKFANEYPNFELHCYVANVFETTAFSDF